MTHLNYARVHAQAIKLKAAKSLWPAADKREVQALADALLAAIPALEDPGSKGRGERLQRFNMNLENLEELADRLDKEGVRSPEANDRLARQVMKRPPPSLSDRYWGRRDEEAGRTPYDELDHPGGEDRGETGEFDPDVDDDGLYPEQNDDE